MNTINKKRVAMAKKENFFIRVINFLDLQLSRLEAFMLAAGVIGMAFMTIAAVITRFVFNNALTVTDEINMIFIVVVTFAGLSYAARNARHIRMSAIYDALPFKIRKTVTIFISFVTALFMFVLTYYSYTYIVEVYQSGRILPTLGIQAFYVYLWVPVGFAVTGLQYGFTVLKNIEEKEVFLSTKVRDGYASSDMAL